MGYYKQLSVVLLAFLCQIALSSSLPFLCPKHQSISLLKFKNSLTIDPSLLNASYLIWGCDTKYYPKTSTWNTSRDCCLWDGVVCDEFTGHVIELDLSCSLLVGTIDSNSTLFQLSHLQRLNLSLNNFSNSNISPKFGRFSSLTHLGLSNSLFSGQIPSEISQLSKLQSLQLSAYLGGDLSLVAHDFKMLLQNFTQLRDLDLYNVYIPSTIPLNFSSHITSLVLPNTGLYGILPQHIFHLPNLKELSLSGNDMLSGSFPKTRWNSSESLMLLDLTFVAFSGNFPESLGYLTSLQRLSLALCNLRGPIPQSLSNLTRIEFLDLTQNSLNGTVPSRIFSLQSLTELHLSTNHFSGHLTNLIKNLVNVEQLDLSFNNFSGNVDVNIFSNLKKLWWLSLSYNRISLTNKNKDKLLPQSLGLLGLANCEVKEIEFLRSVKYLSTLDLSNNKIQGRIPDWAWSNWMSLGSLNLSHNMLTSVDLISLQFLGIIDLRSNFLQGSLPIPSTFITIFIISNNNLNGEIPLSICNLTSLTILDLAKNNLRGEIPQCLSNTSDRLEVFAMHQNNLSGTIPTTFSIRSSLKSFNLHGNELEGKIPRSLANCKKLQVIDLGGNHLNDEFPMWLGTLPKLQVLSLRSNKLHGPIRTSSNKELFPQLRMLDLSYNAFTEKLPTSLFQHFKAMRTIDQTMKVPSYFGDEHGYYQDSVIVATKGLELELVRILTVYTTIDLSSNKFEGHIPSIMGDLIALRILNLSHNGFQGQIPPSLGNLSSVESLDLSANQLSGEIPQKLASLNFLAVLNLSHNHLEGCIPKGPQFATFEKNSYEGNDGLRGFPVSKGCGSNEILERNSTASALDDQETNSLFLIEFLKGGLVGYGSGLCIGLSIVYFTISTGLSNMACKNHCRARIQNCQAMEMEAADSKELQKQKELLLDK